MEFNVIQVIAIYALPVIFAITLHEASHAYAAKYFGDLTAYSQGRMSLNPIKHIDPFGTVILPLMMLALTKLLGGSGFLFGWAKPVPVNFANLRHPKRDMLWVAAAGPGANLVMALIWIFLFKLALTGAVGSLSQPLALMGAAGVLVNAIFMALNLLPIPPLDGGRMAISLLPHRQAYQFSRIEPYGFFIILGLMFLNVLGVVLTPMVSWAVQGVSLVAGVSPYDIFSYLQMLSR